MHSLSFFILYIDELFSPVSHLKRNAPYLSERSEIDYHLLNNTIEPIFDYLFNLSVYDLEIRERSPIFLFFKDLIQLIFNVLLHILHIIMGKLIADFI